MSNLFKEIASGLVAKKVRQLGQTGPVYYQGDSDVLALGLDAPSSMLPPAVFAAVAALPVAEADSIKDSWVRRFTEIAGRHSPTVQATFVAPSQDFVSRERVPIAPPTILIGRHDMAPFEMFDVNYYIADSHLFVVMTSDTQKATELADDYHEAARQTYADLMETYGESADLKACFAWQMQAIDDWVDIFTEEPVKVCIPVDLNSGKTSVFHYGRFEFGKKIYHVAPGGAAFTDDGERVVLADVVNGVPGGPALMRALMAYVCVTARSFVAQLRAELKQASA